MRIKVVEQAKRGEDYKNYNSHASLVVIDDG